MASGNSMGAGNDATTWTTGCKMRDRRGDNRSPSRRAVPTACPSAVETNTRSKVSKADDDQRAPLRHGNVIEQQHELPSAGGQHQPEEQPAVPAKFERPCGRRRRFRRSGLLRVLAHPSRRSLTSCVRSSMRRWQRRCMPPIRSSKMRLFEQIQKPGGHGFLVAAFFDAELLGPDDTGRQSN